MLGIFICNKCGKCCSNLDKSLLYNDLDRGDGTCIHFDEITNSCTIYEERPLKCNIDGMYDTFFKDKMSKDKYYRENYEACKALK